MTSRRSVICDWWGLPTSYYLPHQSIGRRLQPKLTLLSFLQKPDHLHWRQQTLYCQWGKWYHWISPIEGQALHDHHRLLSHHWFHPIQLSELLSYFQLNDYPESRAYSYASISSILTTLGLQSLALVPVAWNLCMPLPSAWRLQWLMWSTISRTLFKRKVSASSLLCPYTTCSGSERIILRSR